MKFTVRTAASVSDRPAELTSIRSRTAHGRSLARPARPGPNMSSVSVSPSSLKEGRLHEYLIRFALGGAATVFTGFISSRFGASIIGLFLAFPAIFCASATLIENHEIRRKREAGLAWAVVSIAGWCVRRKMRTVGAG
jgi:hypothetical protein